MKVILSIFVLVFSVFSFSNQVTANSLFTDTKNEIPYCNDWSDWKCWLDGWVNAVKDVNVIEGDQKASVYIQNVISYVLTFLAILSVLIIIYSWFNILISAWDDDKVSNSKKIIIYAIIWLVIIFLAYPITSFILQIFTDTAKATNP